MKIIILSILLCFCSAALCQKTNLNQSFISDSSFYSEIPYKDENGSVIVTINIQGEPYDFMLDTGAPLIISKTLSDKLQLEVLEKIPVADQSEKIDTMEVVLVDQFRLGEVTFMRNPAIVAEENPILECLGVDGLIGSNVLKNTIIQFNKQEKLVIITNRQDKLNLPKSSTALFLDSKQSNPFINIRLKGKRGKAHEQLLFDSGMDALYYLSENHYNLFNEKVTLFEQVEKGYGSNTYGLHGAANNDDYLRGVVSKLKIGKLTINAVKFSLTKDNNSRIGNELLDYAVITVDYLNKKFYVDPIIKKIDHVKTRFAINPTYTDGKFVVGIIWDKNLEDKVTIGDEIISINETVYQGQTLCELMMHRSAFKNAGINSLKIKYLHEGEEAEITIENKSNY